MTTVKFAKIKENAVIPSKRDEDAGFDIYSCFDEDYIIINPHETRLIPTGICSAFDKDYVFILKERGSTGTKGIGQRAGIIDSGFRSEWWCPLTNHTCNKIIIAKNNISIEQIMYENPHLSFNGAFIYPYEKAICQALLIPVPKVNIQEYSYDEIQNIKSERMNGELGSSGK